jgi:hypothetical protein
MSNDSDQLSTLKDTLKKAQMSLDECKKSHKGFQMFADNRGVMVFCTVQLQEAAVALQKHVDGLVAIARELHATYHAMSEQLELNDIEMNGRP